MSIGGAFQAEVDQSLDLSARMAPAPEKPRERGLWRAAFDSLAGAGAKAQASVVELGQVVGPAIAFASDPSNAEALDTIKRAPNFRQNDMSRPFREYEKTLRPDPVTAGEAEKIVYGAVGPMATLVGSAVVGGVPGILAAGAEAGFSQSEDLAQQGVDLKTRTAVGTLTAGVTAGTALLPMAGQTVKQTLGLYVAGGPGQFVAQQYATRKILETADYAEIAKQYDPFDPTGLALSAIIPAPFAAWGLRGNIKAAKAGKAPEPVPAAPAEPRATPEQTDAAMAHNLTLQRDMREAVEIAPRATEAGSVASLADFAAARKVEAPKTPDQPDTFLAWLREQGGVSAAEKLDITGERAGISRGAIFRKGGLGLDELAVRAEQAGFLPPGSVESAMDNGGTRAFADLVQRAAAGERVLTMDQQIAAARDSRMRAEVEQRVAILEDRLRLLGEDPAPAKGDLDTLESYLAQNEARLMNALMEDISSQQRAMEIEAAAPVRQKQEPEQVSQARTALQDMEDSGKAMPDFAASAKLPPDVQNLLIGLAEAGKDKARADRMLSDFSRAVEAQPGRSAVDIAADVVEASREGRTVTPEPQPAAVTSPEKATAESVQARITELENAAPDMVVRVTEDGQPVTLKAEMERIRREAAEGTDTELGTNDAALLKVAADCALTTGAG